MSELLIKCGFCGGRVKSRKVNFVYDENEDYFFVENVPAEVCSQCGEKTYSPKVTDELIQFAKKRLKPARKVKVPVFDYTVQV
jgi:HTH-type transcriptional regulator / antitoxin MqsA